jgi:hypothetical protein
MYGEKHSFTLVDMQQIKSYGKSAGRYPDPEWFL